MEGRGLLVRSEVGRTKNWWQGDVPDRQRHGPYHLQSSCRVQAFADWGSSGERTYTYHDALAPNFIMSLKLYTSRLIKNLKRRFILGKTQTLHPPSSASWWEDNEWIFLWTIPLNRYSVVLLQKSDWRGGKRGDAERINEGEDSGARAAPVCHFSSLLPRANVTDCFTAWWQSTESPEPGPV